MSSSFIYVVAYGRISFLSMAEWYSIVQIYCILYIHELMTFAFFHFLTNMNSAVMNICVQIFVWTYVFISLGHILWTYMPKKWNFCIINIPCLSFWGIAKLFSKMGAPFCIPSRSVWSFQFFHMHTETCYFLSFWSNHPLWSGCSLWFLICISLVTPSVGHLFMCWVTICRSLKGLFRFLAHLLVGLFVFLLLSCKTSVYFGYKSFIRYMTCRYPFPSRRLSFHFPDGFVCGPKV